MGSELYRRTLDDECMTCGWSSLGGGPHEGCSSDGVWTEESYNPATPADLVAYVAALPADERQAIVEGIVEWDPLLHVWRSPEPAAVFEVTCFDTEEEAVAYAREQYAKEQQDQTTPEMVTAYVAALPADEAQALLVALLRAVPDVAVAAVDSCKVVRVWDPHCSRRYGLNWVQAAVPLGAGFAPLGYDAALLADGWVLAGVTP